MNMDYLSSYVQNIQRERERERKGGVEGERSRDRRKSGESGV